MFITVVFEFVVVVVFFETGSFYVARADLELIGMHHCPAALEGFANLLSRKLFF